MTHRGTEITRGELVRFCAGEVTQTRALELEAHLSTCAACRQEVAAIRALCATIAAPVAGLEHPDLSAGVWQQLAAGESGTRRSKRGMRWALAVALPLVAVALAVTLRSASRRAESEPDEGFRAKAASHQASADAWIGVKAFAIDVSGAARRAAGSIRASDGLAFSYTNLGAEPFDYLLIVAIDELGQIYWVFPELTSPGADPTSIPIEHGQADRELLEQVKHAWRGNELAIYAVFSHAALRVSEVEGLLSALHTAGELSTSDPPRLAIPDSGQQRLVLQVQR